MTDSGVTPSDIFMELASDTRLDILRMLEEKPTRSTDLSKKNKSDHSGNTQKYIQIIQGKNHPKRFRGIFFINTIR
ncbi:Hypothetical protein Nlim_1288 [Candidatus Nitrosarchaeum limnium SFB1]|uniref:Uncharacterized protein n=1 Tax=Candidatus Nitrosarchaeum limnium SFB1 TaxID=886738 RepID=F3KLA8_9ARCH|nr:Hypothetical protein Nlim_1288 [Candidatus Nitrosarchaeum limnium SFB1]